MSSNSTTLLARLQGVPGVEYPDQPITVDNIIRDKLPIHGVFIEEVLGQTGEEVLLGFQGTDSEYTRIAADVLAGFPYHYVKIEYPLGVSGEMQIYTPVAALTQSILEAMEDIAADPSRNAEYAVLVQTLRALITQVNERYPHFKLVEVPRTASDTLGVDGTDLGSHTVELHYLPSKATTR